MKRAIPAVIVLALVILSPTSLAVTSAPPVKHITMQVEVTNNNTHVPATVYVNGMNLNNKVNDLQNEFDSLVNDMMKTKMTVVDFLYMTQLKDKLLKAYDDLLVKLLTSNKTSPKEISNIINKREAVQAKADALLIRMLSSISSSSEHHETKSLGWYDMFGNHRAFTDTELINYPIDLRITDCYSSIGRSAVLKGGTIYITGFLYTYGTTVSDGFKVKLIDPETNSKPELLLSTGQGENCTGTKASLKWRTSSSFVISINTSDMPCGLNEVDISYRSYTVSCQFYVIKPYIHIQKFGQYTRITTNYPELVVYIGKSRYHITPINGIAWVHATRIKVDGVNN